MAYPLETVVPTDGAAVPTAVNLELLTAAARSLLQPDHIPQPLKDLAQWTGWRFKDEGPGKKPGKPPINARTGGYASTKDPSTWSTFDDALAAFNADSTLAGLNIVLTPDDPIVAIDIDDYTGNDPAAAAALSSFTGTYAERSPSGGLHIFAFGKSPGGGLKTNGIFEVKRALTVTGCRVNGHAAELTEQQPAIDRYHRVCLTKPTATLPTPDPDMPDFMAMSDEEIEALIGGDIDGDTLSMRCPRCGSPAEYPDCEACGYDLTQAPDTTGQQPDIHPTDTKKNSATAAGPFSFVSVDYADRLRLAIGNAEIRALYAGELCGRASRNEAEQALCLRLMTFADGRTDIVAGWMDASGCTKWLERDKDSDVYRSNTLAAARRKWDGRLFEDKWESAQQHGAELSAALLKNRQSGADDREPGADDEPDIAGHTGTKPLFIPVSEFIGIPSAPAWTVRKWLPEASIIQLFGDPSSGKSFLAIDWACCVATGKEWNGNRVKQGAVIYIAGEGHHGLRRRFAAWQQVHGTLPSSLYVSKRAVILDANGAKAVYQAVKDIPEVPGLIVVDTMATVLHGDENKGEDVNAFISILKNLIAGTRACCLVVHHSGHGDKSRGRGWSGLPGAIDGGFKMTKDADLCGELTVTKDPKDGARPAALSFELEVVELPEAWNDPEEPDEPVTSCVFRVTGKAGQAGQAGTKPKKLPASQTIALKALEKAMVSHGGTFSGQFGVNLEDWRDAAYKAGIADTPEAKKKAFQRSRNDLLATGHVVCADDIYWFADDGKQSAAAMLNTAKRKQKESVE